VSRQPLEQAQRWRVRSNRSDIELRGRRVTAEDNPISKLFRRANDAAKGKNSFAHCRFDQRLAS